MNQNLLFLVTGFTAGLVAGFLLAFFIQTSLSSRKSKREKLDTLTKKKLLERTIAELAEEMAGLKEEIRDLREREEKRKEG